MKQNPFLHQIYLILKLWKDSENKIILKKIKFIRYNYKQILIDLKLCNSNGEAKDL